MYTVRGANYGMTGILSACSTDGRSGNTTAGTVIEGWRQVYSTCGRRSTARTSRTSVVDSHTMTGCTPTAANSTLPPPIGHRPCSCRRKDARDTALAPRSPDLLRALVYQTISRNQCGHPHLAGTWSRCPPHTPPTGSCYRVLAGDVTVKRALRSQ